MDQDAGNAGKAEEVGLLMERLRCAEPVVPLVELEADRASASHTTRPTHLQAHIVHIHIKRWHQTLPRKNLFEATTSTFHSFDIYQLSKHETKSPKSSLQEKQKKKE